MHRADLLRNMISRNLTIKKNLVVIKMKIKEGVFLSFQILIYLTFVCSNETKQDVPTQPNIVLILADDFGYNDVGYHNPYVYTPNIDELARTGLILEQSYVQPLCTPTRSALLTGVYPYLMGRQGIPIAQAVPTGLTLERRLLPQYLKEKGYVTHAIGKWHLGFCNEKYLPTNRGFDSHYGYYGGGQYYYSHVHNRAGGYDFVYNAETDLSANNTYGEELFANRFTEVIKNHVANEESSPLFVYMAHQATHEPLEPPQEFLDLYPDVADGLRKQFFATASSMDIQVGRMVQDLKDTGMYENTIIIFLGDNGGRHGAGGNNWPLRGEKNQVYEGGVRTPGFIHSPLLQNSGVVSTKLTHVTDWLPTLYHLAGATNDEIEVENFNGVNQWSCIQDPSRPDARDEIVINLDDDKGVTVGALRQGSYKLVKYSTQHGDSDWFLPPEWNSTVTVQLNKLDNVGDNDYEIGLYNVSSDMEERINLVEELPEIYDQMSLRMEELKVDLVPNDQPRPVDGGLLDGVWTTGWC